jgi:hypothetical protein
LTRDSASIERVSRNFVTDFFKRITSKAHCGAASNENAERAKAQQAL